MTQEDGIFDILFYLYITNRSLVGICEYLVPYCINLVSQKLKEGNFIFLLKCCILKYFKYIFFKIFVNMNFSWVMRFFPQKWNLWIHLLSMKVYGTMLILFLKKAFWMRKTCFLRKSRFIIYLQWGTGKHSPWAMFYVDTSVSISVSMVRVSFYATEEEWSSCDRNQMAFKSTLRTLWPFTEKNLCWSLL